MGSLKKIINTHPVFKRFDWKCFKSDSFYNKETYYGFYEGLELRIWDYRDFKDKIYYSFVLIFNNEDSMRSDSKLVFREYAEELEVGLDRLNKVVNDYFVQMNKKLKSWEKVVK